VTLYGSDPTEGIVAVEKTSPTEVTLYHRDGSTITDRLRPWLISESEKSLSGSVALPLDGDHPLRWVHDFSSWNEYQDASRTLYDSPLKTFRLRSPVEQYLLRSGKTLFRGMTFGDLRRCQLDIETTSLSPESGEIIGIALIDPKGDETYLTRDPREPEAVLLNMLNDWFSEHDPDVIEGHNLFNFDLPFLVRRAEILNVCPTWGRDESSPWFPAWEGKYKAGAASLPYQPCHIRGRHIVDSYQQVQRYDVGAGKLSSYGLKSVIRELGLEREGREHVDGSTISDLWQTAEGRTRLARYALDDVRDVRTLVEVTTQTEFYQTQLIPRSYQSVATGGTGEKINDLMARAYLSRGYSLPLPQPKREYPGGFVELLEVGVFSPVVKCDVESLYPSLMLTQEIVPASDTLGVMLPMLSELKDRRLKAKTMSKVTDGPERTMWEGLQGSYKILINSFYGYLGYSGALFNDYDAAALVTEEGRKTVQAVTDRIRSTGGMPIEVDTDGVFFVPPVEFNNPDKERQYVDVLGDVLPEGINLAHDGSYAAMLSLKAKNYALLDTMSPDGKVTLKGASLRSRKMEPILREWLNEATLGFMLGLRDEVRERYFGLAREIRDREISVEEFAQRGAISDKNLGAQPRLRTLVSRLGIEIREGDKLDIYEREDGSLGVVSEYARDENVTYLLRRLHDAAERFRDLFPTEGEFRAFFPKLTQRTDLVDARSQLPFDQLTLFV
jgi:DNA polymerase I